MPQAGEEFRASLTPDREDDLAFDYPKTPSLTIVIAAFTVALFFHE